MSVPFSSHLSSLACYLSSPGTVHLSPVTCRYNEIFFMIDTCQAASMFQVCNLAPNWLQWFKIGCAITMLVGTHFKVSFFAPSALVQVQPCPPEVLQPRDPGGGEQPGGRGLPLPPRGPRHRRLHHRQVGAHIAGTIHITIVPTTTILPRYTYYALDFLERVTPDSKKTMGEFLKVCTCTCTCTCTFTCTVTSRFAPRECASPLWAPGQTSSGWHSCVKFCKIHK